MQSNDKLINKYVHIYIPIYLSTSVYIIYIQMHINKSRSMVNSSQLYIYICLKMYIYIYKDKCISVCICRYIYIYTCMALAVLPLPLSFHLHPQLPMLQLPRMFLHLFPTLRPIGSTDGHQSTPSSDLSPAAPKPPTTCQGSATISPHIPFQCTDCKVLHRASRVDPRTSSPTLQQVQT